MLWSLDCLEQRGITPQDEEGARALVRPLELGPDIDLRERRNKLGPDHEVECSLSTAKKRKQEIRSSTKRVIEDDKLLEQGASE